MNKTQIKRYLPFAGLILLALAATAAIFWLSPLVNFGGKSGQAPTTAPEKIESVKDAADSNPDANKKNLVVLKETGDIYYYAADGLRYMFPNSDIYKSWFGDYQPQKTETVEEMQKTQLKGAVTMKPGSLIMTDSDFKVYLVANHSVIYSLSREVLIEIYGIEWEKQVVNLPNWFFAYYTQGGGIENLGALPAMPKRPTIEENIVSR